MVQPMQWECSFDGLGCEPIVSSVVNIQNEISSEVQPAEHEMRRNCIRTAELRLSCDSGQRCHVAERHEYSGDIDSSTAAGKASSDEFDVI